MHRCYTVLEGIDVSVLDCVGRFRFTGTGLCWEVLGCVERCFLVFTSVGLCCTVLNTVE